jgi:hypothetical protein
MTLQLRVDVEIGVRGNGGAESNFEDDSRGRTPVIRPRRWMDRFGKAGLLVGTGTNETWSRSHDVLR